MTALSASTTKSPAVATSSVALVSPGANVTDVGGVPASIEPVSVTRTGRVRATATTRSTVTSNAACAPSVTVVDGAAIETTGGTPPGMVSCRLLDRALPAIVQTAPVSEQDSVAGNVTVISTGPEGSRVRSHSQLWPATRCASLTRPPVTPMAKSRSVMSLVDTASLNRRRSVKGDKPLCHQGAASNVAVSGLCANAPSDSAVTQVTPSAARLSASRTAPASGTS